MYNVDYSFLDKQQIKIFTEAQNDSSCKNTVCAKFTDTVIAGASKTCSEKAFLVIPLFDDVSFTILIMPSGTRFGADSLPRNCLNKPECSSVFPIKKFCVILVSFEQPFPDIEFCNTPPICQFCGKNIFILVCEFIIV